MVQSSAKFRLRSLDDFLNFCVAGERKGGGSGATQVARVYFRPLNLNGTGVQMKK